MLVSICRILRRLNLGKTLLSTRFERGNLKPEAATFVSRSPALAGAAASEKKRVSSQNVGVKFSTFHGTAILEPAVSSSARKSERSKKVTWRSSQVRASSLSNLVKAIVTSPLSPLKSAPTPVIDTVEIKGTLVLTKKYTLDLVNVPAKVVDDQFDMLFHQLVSLQLVSVDAGTDGHPKLSRKSNIEKWSDPKGSVPASLKEKIMHGTGLREKITNGSALREKIIPGIGAAEKIIPGSGLKEKVIAGEETYDVTFQVPKDFGEIGAFVIKNHHPNEFYLHSLTLGPVNGVTYEFPCDSWVYNDIFYGDVYDRVFFTNKTYLPGQTPSGLKLLRERELIELRGTGRGLRHPWDRIYDYDIYNDLGHPDLHETRPPLGGSKEFPYPRRCRTGRIPDPSDPKSEIPIPVGDVFFYVPADEQFTRIKKSGFLASSLVSFVHGVLPTVLGLLNRDDWQSISQIMKLYVDGVEFAKNLSYTLDPEKNAELVFFNTIFNPEGSDQSVIKYPSPQILDENPDSWMDDEEFGRQTLAGINPCVIEAVKEFPPTSSLDPHKFGPATALTEGDIKPYLEGLTVQEAIKAKRLFKVDYRDLLMPYIERMNKPDTSNEILKNKWTSRAYAPRTYFFRTSKGTMKPVAIELSLPPTATAQAGINRVFTPPTEKEGKNILWDLAKLHFSAIDFGYHELISHWLRTHCAVEPFAIATHRQLSELHPVHKLLLPLFKNTMMINAVARQALINADGIIELTFSPGPYSMEISSKVYGALWRFDYEALPENLVARGMAEPADASHPGGVKLVVDDYPFAKDGLELWDAIHKYTENYLNHVYKGSDKAVKDDLEVQEWWKDVVERGHGDKKDEPWWPKPASIKSLTEICTTIAWVAGPHHAAVNFGQYAYGGFMPNKPSHCRRFIPDRGSKEEEEMLKDPNKWLMSTISGQFATALVMTILELLSTHAVDEEYQGKRLNDNWTSDPQIKALFHDFALQMKDLEARIDKRNADPSLHNRTAGPAGLPYTLLYPKSESSGLTGRGVPYSTSI
ncbi:hypothetical protein R1flu_027148 [Riccia fluitans]|uniref:Lipoxygenase n=1 Tax=Riccia fluitans TaxID=41844 RepID=A0ABD1XIH4_9MARC